MSPHHEKSTAIDSHIRLFDGISSIYGASFHSQHKHYSAVLAEVWNELDLGRYHTILDVGCGTGALAAAFQKRGLSVVALDASRGMVLQAKKRLKESRVALVQGNAGGGLPFATKQFDLSIASYVAHGLQKSDRLRLYEDMARVSRSLVIIYDYNQHRSPITSFVEWLEHGDYFNFIRDPQGELEEARCGKWSCFTAVRVIQVSPRAAWYVCSV